MEKVKSKKGKFKRLKKLKKDKSTTITIHQSTKEALDQYGKKGETYDDILWKLMRGYKRWIESTPLVKVIQKPDTR